MSGSVLAMSCRIRSAIHMYLKNIRSFGSCHLILEMKRMSELRRGCHFCPTGVIGRSLVPAASVQARFRMWVVGSVYRCRVQVTLRLATTGAVARFVIPGMLLRGCELSSEACKSRCDWPPILLSAGCHSRHAAARLRSLLQKRANRAAIGRDWKRRPARHSRHAAARLRSLQ